MKTKLFVAIISIIVVAGIVIYLLIPSPQTASGSVRFLTSTNGAYRSLIKQETWDKWSPQTFSVTKRLNNSLEVNVKNEQHNIPVSILLIPMSSDSVTVSWNTVFPVTANPFTKIKQRSQANAVKNKMDDALSKFQQFVSHNENIYGTHIEETSTEDTFLLATRFTSHIYPTNELIYSNINKLKSYAKSVGAKESGAPMLNISTADSSTFSCMVALPVNRIVAGKGDVFFVRMVPGHFLRTEVTGGPHTIANAHRMMDQYFKDFNRVTMAIPFEYLVTDRLKEADTSKWITRVYGPVY
jgi:DNA-directed RNA polymerase subunit L